MESRTKIPIREIIKVVLSALLIAIIIGGALFVADCNQCVYTDSERIFSPDGAHVVSVHSSSPHPFTLDTYKIRVTAANDGWMLDTVAVTEKYSGVLSWTVEWPDNDTVLLTLDTVSYCKTVTIDFSTGVPTFSE